MAEKTKAHYKQVVSELRESLGWMDLVLSNINEGILVVDDDSRITFANDAIGEMINRPRITLLEEAIWEVDLAAEGEVLGKHDFQKGLTEDNIESLRGRYKLGGDSEKIIDITTAYIQKIEQVTFIIRDVTQQVQSQEKLMKERIAFAEEQIERQKAEENERLLQNILDGTTAIIYLKDTTGRYIMVNDRFKKVFGFGTKELKGKKDAEIFSEEIARKLSKNDNKVIESQDLMRWEESISYKNESYTFLSVKYPVHNTPDESFSICGVLTDITARKELEKRKDNFIRMASHELQTPLLSIKMLLDGAKTNIKEGKIEKSLRDFSKFEEQLDNIKELVENLLDISKMETDKLELEQRKFDLNVLVKETIEVVQRTTDHHTIHFQNGSKNTSIFADRQRIEQVLINLLTNAVKYSPEGDEVIVRLKSDPDHVTVSVQDFGVGISEDQQENIFDRFYKGSTPVKIFRVLAWGFI